MTLLALTPEQRTANLAKAAAARTERAELLAAIRTATLEVAEVLARDDEIAKRLKVTQLLCALPGYGPARVAALITECGIRPDRRVGGLGTQQRTQLLARLTGLMTARPTRGEPPLPTDHQSGEPA